MSHANVLAHACTCCKCICTCACTMYIYMYNRSQGFMMHMYAVNMHAFTCAVDLEIFVLRNFRMINFRVKKIS